MNKPAKELTLEREKEVIPIDDQAIQSLSATPMQMINAAVASGKDLEYVAQLMELERVWKADKAREAYHVAMTAFKSEPIEILKDRSVSFGTTSYKHASLHGAVMAAAPMLSKHGLSHNWKTEQGDGGQITVSCVITHQQGHSEITSLSAGADQSGGKNNIQSIASTVSYLERYTFLAATGLTAKDMDDDGQGAEVHETISEEQIADLESMITEVGANKIAFLSYCKVTDLGQILAKNYHFAVQALEAKRKA